MSSDIRRQHDFEEMETTMFNMARVIASYYHELINAGVPDQLAMMLVVEWQKSVFAKDKKES